jgi:hypothetical protein
LIHVQRSDDDGFTWHRAGDPIVGQGSLTGDTTKHDRKSPIVADAFSHNVYILYAPASTGNVSAPLNQIYLSRSTDGGNSWTPFLIYRQSQPLNLTIFLSLAVDPTNGKLYATWSDSQSVWFSTSSDQGTNWSAPIIVNAAPASMAIFPWVAAYNGIVDIAYYATDSLINDSKAIWNVYLAQTKDNGASFQQSKVSNHPNHLGFLCTNGDTCVYSTRTMLDDFQVAIDANTGLAAVAYADDTVTTDSTGAPLPIVVLGRQQ